MNKKRKIEEQIKGFEKRIADAENYVKKGVNVEGAAWLHFDDWNGKSGHPLWVKNFMIPITKKLRTKKERALATIKGKEKDKRFKQRSGQKG